MIGREPALAKSVQSFTHGRAEAAPPCPLRRRWRAESRANPKSAIQNPESKSAYDLLDGYVEVALAMAPLAVDVLAAPEDHADDFFAFDFTVNTGDYLGPSDERLADPHVGALPQHEHLGELDPVLAFAQIAKVHAEGVALLHPILPTAVLKDCVHSLAPVGSIPK
jgi:hypothetical protein